MGQKASKPGPPSTRMQVLALGIPRTGTSSMSAALEILLQEPSYHGGAQLLVSSIGHMRKWLAVHEISRNARQSGRPVTGEEKDRIKTMLAQLYRGFASCSDTPAFYYAQELVEVYPDAQVIVTIRDRDRWWQSKVAVNNAMRKWWLPYVLWPIPAGVRYWPYFGKTMIAGVYGERYFLDGEAQAGPQTYDRHLEYLKRIVPKERLHFLNLKDGWEPLCKILGKDVPDVPFPHLNETAALDRILAERKPGWG